MLTFKLRNTPFDDLLNFFILCAAFVFGDVAEFVEQFLFYAQGIARFIILRFANPP